MTGVTTSGADAGLGRAARVAAVGAGVVALLAGGVAVFVTDNEVGSAALVAAGTAMVGVAAFGNRIHAIEAGGVRLELELQRRARHARQQAELARAAGHDTEAAELEDRAQQLLAAAGAVGSRYEHLLSTEPSGWDRTSRMEAALREARGLDAGALTTDDVAGLFATGSVGNRIGALALIEGHPRLATAEVLVEAIERSESSFEQYHGLVAAERAVDHLSGADRARVRSAVQSVLAGPLGERSSDRRTVARRVLDRLGP